jgi:hypothetical protein
MTSFRQVQANRRNALKSTGPITSEGKQKSRRNAVRHGLTAETVIGSLEDAEDYKAFEATIVADYEAESAVERELVLRLASLLWRLRRATAMETGLFDLQTDREQTFSAVHPVITAPVYPLLLRSGESVPAPAVSATERDPGSAPEETSCADDLGTQLARRFLQLANLPNYALDRLSRYEAVLWRQAGQILFVLDALRRRKPQARRSSFFRGWP